MAKKTALNGKLNGSTKSAATRVSTESEAAPTRLAVLKTYKIYVGGKFPRTESGRYFLFSSTDGTPLANVCDCSRKDLRDAVVVARSAFGDWSKRTAFNRGQILYRIAEMLEGRSAQFIHELTQAGLAASAASAEVQKSIDRLVYYSGWADKYQQVFSSVNPVSSSYFNFSALEPTGVVSVIAPDESPLLGLISVIAPAIVGGNTVIALASASNPLVAITLAEVLATSDLPGGVVNLLTGKRKELLDPFTTHMDINAVIYCGSDPAEAKKVRENSSLNIKRPTIHAAVDWASDDAQNPYHILDTQEVKTTWHPVGI